MLKLDFLKSNQKYMYMCETLYRANSGAKGWTKKCPEGTNVLTINIKVLLRQTWEVYKMYNMKVLIWTQLTVEFIVPTVSVINI